MGHLVYVRQYAKSCVQHQHEQKCFLVFKVRTEYVSSQYFLVMFIASITHLDCDYTLY